MNDPGLQESGLRLASDKSVLQAYLCPCGQPASSTASRSSLIGYTVSCAMSLQCRISTGPFDRHEEDVTTNNAIKKMQLLLIGRQAEQAKAFPRCTSCTDDACISNNHSFLLFHLVLAASKDNSP